MPENKENRKIGFQTDENTSSDEKSGLFGFINKNSEKEISSEDKNILEEQKELLDTEKQKRTEDFSDKKDINTSNQKEEIEKGLRSIIQNKRIKNMLDSFKKMFSKKEKSSVSSVLKTNLIQGETTITFDWKKNITPILFSIFFSTLILGGAFGGLIIWEDRSINRGTELIQETEALIVQIKQAQKKSEKVDIFQKKIGLVKYLLDEHVYWTNFFEFLEKNTLSNSYYQGGFSGDAKGAYTFSVITDSYSSINDFVNVLENNKNVFQIETKGAKIGVKKGEKTNSQGATSFELSVKINPLLFKK
ncbi:hypothetical protein A2331_02205 [Candidatus Falkowbacteria bacterium RIFOXYB2_FULL_34_18]|uniref:Uncharacterized protein n=1 Tax=Candidatus Falkowbacteria bacterium RIFOXYD2_FULL_34_120 TaxID=1798007 RepID=A0A1F5TR53_9BACT|nr:MAG: hypothetical protein A2331_02205 [Candidatus Falkowbacteria bacterium RIFOXYB2_FULL_34_18]OGF29519.1 MAG: hypothetical protein A2500_02325 [Candidatus Falkowbacteria bacterium RIFOXYC12_FULL_34_55]OGF36871.1 MAG: hypothetical protein A2466_06645 [Candidatus Falkowbacteria bacterium RIFOXYC2_FULL_34_220]OGF39070.1 MAG: hypothetical protein A2515_04650 [Candidatus Falkowbacteria bacterium RIFOXYD12_FULL_34_57]OGF41277.1 MAG: hypothetical protein A2531_00240 [Candidatus Falkowbacteria bact